MLFDTDILIWIQRDNLAAIQTADIEAKRFVSIVTYMEFLQGSPSARVMALNRDFLRKLDFTILPLSEAIGIRAAAYIEQHAPTHGLRANDALIAATAVEHNLPLATSNVKHYRFIGALEVKHIKP